SGAVYKAKATTSWSSLVLPIYSSTTAAVAEFRKCEQAAENWVAKNVSSHISSGGIDISLLWLLLWCLCSTICGAFLVLEDLFASNFELFIRYVAVGNEPFLSTYNGSFLGTTLPALQNIQSALTKAGLDARVKVTVPLNADVYESPTNLPSDGNFRSDIQDLMLSIVKFLSDNGAPFTVNIYPFISLYTNPNFPLGFAFFNNSSSSSFTDGGKIYDNVFDANHDTLVWALQKNGYGNLSIVIGEIGWPTDGDQNANLNYAQQFNQGFMNNVIAGKGTPMRPAPVDAYLFSLLDEDAKSIQPASLDDPQVAPSVSYACARADCTSLGYGTSCGDLSAQGNISYAFNSYYQQNNQLESACGFPDNLSVVTSNDPSTGTCKFRIMIQSHSVTSGVEGGRGFSMSSFVAFAFAFLSAFL
ncbi:hypothetical protein D5086_031347, partial [Populus alba]